MTLKLYHFPRSRSLRVVWAAQELGLDCEIEVMPFDRATFATEEYRRLNPLGKTPVFYDGEERLVESVAIIHYLSEKYGGGKFSRQPTDADYGQFLQWLHFGEGGMGAYVGMLIGQTYLLPEEQRIPAMKAWAEHETRNVVNFIEASIGDKEYLLGDDFTIADISVGYMLYLLKITGNGKMLGENTAEYFGRLVERPAWAKSSNLGISKG